MPPRNPYEATDLRAERNLETETCPRSTASRFVRFLIGFAAGAALPVGIGVDAMSQWMGDAASFPPGTPTCGNAALGPVFLIIFVAPIVGLITGSIANRIR